MNPTIAHEDRWKWFPEVGCIACLLDDHPNVLPDVAHETNGGRREGHEYTFPLYPYHHRGVLPNGIQPKDAERRLGPSFASSKRRFEARYGTESELVEMTDAIIAKHKQLRLVNFVSPTEEKESA